MLKEQWGESWEASRHWTRTEPLGNGAVIRSFDLSWVLRAAEYRLEHPTCWERLLGALERRLWHRFTAARITE